MRRFFGLLLVMLLLSITPLIHSQEASNDCPNALPTRLARQNKAQVVYEDEVSVHDRTANNSDINGTLETGDLVIIVRGPECEDSSLWWDVRAVDRDAFGWIREGTDVYWLEPLPAHELELDLADIQLEVNMIAEDAELSIAAEMTVSMGGAFPERVQIALQEYPLEIMPSQQIQIIPVDYMNTYNPTEIAALRDVLAEQADDLTEVPAPAQFGAAQLFVSRVEYLESETVNGVRFLTQYAQASVPIINNIEYVFQGFTQDENYYVSVTLPIRSDELVDGYDEVPEEIFEQMHQFETYQAYLGEVVAELNLFPEESFTPLLEELDDFVLSIGVGNAEAEPETTEEGG